MFSTVHNGGMSISAPLGEVWLRKWRHQSMKQPWYSFRAPHIYTYCQSLTVSTLKALFVLSTTAGYWFWTLQNENDVSIRLLDFDFRTGQPSKLFVYFGAIDAVKKLTFWIKQFLLDIGPWAKKTRILKGFSLNLAVPSPSCCVCSPICTIREKLK